MMRSPKVHAMRLYVLPILSLLAASPALAQDRAPQGQPRYGASNQQGAASPQPVQAGRTADTGAGQIGERQTRAQAAPNVEPLGRIQNRVANRVQNRIRNRIDRNYDPQANTTSPFRAAGERTRRAGNAPR